MKMAIILITITEMDQKVRQKEDLHLHQEDLKMEI